MCLRLQPAEIKRSLLLAITVSTSQGDRDDKKWVWSENNRNSNARSYLGSLVLQNPKNRYNVFEETNAYRPPENSQYFPNNQPLSRPKPIYENRPPLSGAGTSFLPDERPGGVYAGSSYRPDYGSQGPYVPQQESPGILTGPVPSWVKEGSVNNFDKCKCTEKFNCNSPGISYGHCDVGKQYCCYSTKKDYGSPSSSKPVHSIENGILAGPGGPVDPIPGTSSNLRPPKQLGSGFYRPGGFQHSQPSLGANNYHGTRPLGLKEPNEYSPANGILVGPDGPYDIPLFGLARSAKPGREGNKAS